MQVDVAKEVAALPRMTVQELRAKHVEAFGEDTNTKNKAWLVKRIAWRLQALAEGGLSERARQRAAELVNDADVRLRPPKDITAPVKFKILSVSVVLPELPCPQNAMLRISCTFVSDMKGFLSRLKGADDDVGYGADVRVSGVNTPGPRPELRASSTGLRKATAR